MMTDEQAYNPAVATGREHKPIGYLIKRLDEALNHFVDGLLGERHGVGRAHWQLVRTVHSRPGITRGEFAADARIFYGEDKLATLIGDLTERGWLVLDGSGPDAVMSLTDTGKENFDAMAKTQMVSGERLIEGMTAADFELVLVRLEQMIANLERP